MAAAYTAAILRNHPFFDGNKRTGFVVGILFLELNGYNFIATKDAATQAVIELAAGTLDEAGCRAFLTRKFRGEIGKVHSKEADHAISSIPGASAA
jgi:death-on-curing protein